MLEIDDLVGVMFSGLSALVIGGVEDENDLIRVMARTRVEPVPCPVCGALAGRVHGFCSRTVMDVPVDGRRVVMSVQVRRLVCPARGCPRQTFREQVPRAGWLIQSGSPLTGKQIADARKIAAAAGLSIETRTIRAAFGNVRTGATAIGILLALGILAMTAGLIRSEAAADLRTLTATGATRRIRRTLTATTRAPSALLGVVLGAGGTTCLSLLAVYRHDLAVFSRVPIAFPLGIVIGTPLIAAVAGWFFAGQEPPAIARWMGE